MWNSAPASCSHAARSWTTSTRRRAPSRPAPYSPSFPSPRTTGSGTGSSFSRMAHSRTSTRKAPSRPLEVFKDVGKFFHVDEDDVRVRGLGDDALPKIGVLGIVFGDKNVDSGLFQNNSSRLLGWHDGRIFRVGPQCPWSAWYDKVK